MIENFVFTLGLPGCGKSSYLDEHYNTAFNPIKQSSGYNISTICSDVTTFLNNSSYIEGEYIYVAADDIKEDLEGFSNDHPEVVHEESVQLARQLVLNLSLSPIAVNVIMDGGGINNYYTESILRNLRQNCPNVKITCLFFDTPIDVCIERVSKRERKVPISAIYDKNLKIVECINRYIPLIDDFIRVDYYTNKYIFLDMDGTIVSYQKAKLDQEGNSDFVNSQIFLTAKPVKYIIDYIKTHFDMNNVYILSAIPNSEALKEKLIWLQTNFPEFQPENMLWVGNKMYKHVFLKHFAIKKKWKPKDITMIDDFHDTLVKCTKYGMNAIHPSNIEALHDKYSTLG